MPSTIERHAGGRGGQVPPGGIMQGQLELRGVHFHYPTRPDAPVLRGVDIKLAPGKSLALVGPSGSGKSTIGSLLLRLYDATEGEVLVDGRPVQALDLDWLRRNVGVVGQEPLLFRASIRENIRFARPDATDEEVMVAAKEANAHGFIESFPEGYDTEVGERGTSLSGGQKQRVAIARAILSQPKVLLLDEATSALDSKSERVVQEALERCMKGKTVLAIAHRLSSIAGCDEIVVLDQGRVLERGTHAELLAKGGAYARLVSGQMIGGNTASDKTVLQRLFGDGDKRAGG
jgi:ATP-binding cassette subfamily B protein